MSKHPLLLGLTLLSASLFTGQAFADRTVTDQLGRQVTLPDHVTRAVVLQHQTLNLLVQLNASDEIVGVMSSWKKQLGPAFARFMPGIEQLPTPGDLTQVNIESLLAKPAYQSRNSKFVVQMPGGRKEVLKEENDAGQQAQQDAQGGSLFD